MEQYFHPQQPNLRNEIQKSTPKRRKEGTIFIEEGIIEFRKSFITEVPLKS